MDAYESFIESRLRDGESVDAIRDRLNGAFAASTELCLICRKRKSTLLCDGRIGGPPGEKRGGRPGEVDLRFYAVEAKLWTCDLPMCSTCATQAGITFWPPSAGGPEITDYCPGCVRRSGHQRYRPRPMTEGEARRIRAAWWDESTLAVATHERGGK